MAWRGCHLDVARRFYSSERDQAVPRHPGLEQAQRVPLAPERRRGVAGRDRRLSGADRDGGVARPWLAHAAAARIGTGAERRLLLQGRQVREIVALGPSASASRSCRRSMCPAIATRCCRRSAAARAIAARTGSITRSRAFPTIASTRRSRAVYAASNRSSARWWSCFPRAISMSAPTKCRPRHGSSSPRANALLAAAGRNRGRGAAGALPAAHPGVPHAQGQDHRRLGGSRAGRRHRQGTVLSCRLAHVSTASQKLAAEGYRGRRGPGAGLLPRHGQRPGLARARRRLGRLVVAREDLRVRSPAGLERRRADKAAGRAGLHLVASR